MKKCIMLILVYACGIMVIGCGSGGGGGGGGSTADSSNTGSSTLTEAASGIWSGTVQSGVAGSTCDPTIKPCDIVGVADENNVLRLLNVTTGDQFSGIVYGSGKTISTTLTLYPQGSGVVIETVQISGSVDDAVNPKTMTLQYTSATDSGTIQLTYNENLYVRSSLLTVIADNNWMSSTDAITIYNSGAVSGQLTFNTLSCGMTGNIQNIDTLYNAYAVRLTIDDTGSCAPVGGYYSGLGYSDDMFMPGDSRLLIFLVSKADGALFLVLTR